MPAKNIHEYENPTLQNEIWGIERVGWIILVVFIILAFLGFFGQGLAFHQDSGDFEKNGLVIHYDRFVHRHANLELKVDVSPGQSQTYKVRLNNTYLHNQFVENITPDPSLVSSSAEFTEFTFSRPAGTEISKIYFLLKPNKPGKYNISISLAGREPVSVNQLIYP